ncbi:acyltransferase [Rhizobium sp. Root482]|uniref:acyltransferase n=1 Tax=Rhizobium sp. Root482 TaxID=1736543 RepID=UPI0006FAFF18|nr:hypothetical protein [Rhizobium sp. Root482]KQY25963.1 hypothetical protein ASD31_20275 [Rhizobium sp. Root482]
MHARFKVNETIGKIDVDLPDYLDELAIADLKDGFASVRCIGDDNILFRGPRAVTSKLAISVKGDRNRIILGSDVNLEGSISIGGSHITVLIGAATTFNQVRIFCKGRLHGVYIGRDCMFSSDVEIRTSDSHSIVDLDAMKKLNEPDGVYIGDHVWVSKRVFVQKGAVIGDDNIVGFGASVFGEIRGSNARIVGAPAQAVTSKRVTWSRKGNIRLPDDDLYAWKDLPLL